MAKKPSNPDAQWPFPAGVEPDAEPVQHSVTATLVNVELPKAMHALKLEIYSKAGKTGKLGELEIGQGALYWKGKGRTKTKRIGWSAFAEMMDHLAYSK